MDLDWLTGRIDELGSVGLETGAYRHVAPGVDPGSGEGARIHGGRWNPPESFACLYFGLDRETAAGELKRLAARQSLRPEDLMPRELHHFRVRLQAVLDLQQPEAQAGVGLSPEIIRRDDASPTQRVGEAAHYLGLEGVLAPSAAGPGLVLAVFLDRLRPGSIVEPTGHEVWSSPLPARGA